MKSYASIFNDVIGPVMTGPSSSHTAGSARIGKMTRQLFGREIKKADIIFFKDGSYVNTYVGQGSNYGFTGGLMNFAPEDVRLKNALEIALEKGVEIRFKISEDTAGHPNEARINILDDEGETVLMTLLTRSTGGGMFEIIEMDGFPVSIQGTRDLLFVLGTNLENIEKGLESDSYEKIQSAGKTLLILSGCTDKETMEKIQGQDNVIFVRRAPRLLPLETRGRPPFLNACEALKFAKAQNLSLSGLAVAYECSMGEISPGEVTEKMHTILRYMRESAIIEKEGTGAQLKLIEPQAYKMIENAEKIPLADVGILKKGMLYAVAVMENNCAHNIVVAAPTAGSCGVIPGSVIAVGEEMQLDDEEIVQGLLASGLIGAFIANAATFGAEVAGCQAEIGAASTMAAAGVAAMLGGTVEQCFNAASIAMQNMLGLICDPVGGLTEIPCISRNVSGAANAVTSANMALCGFDGLIPLDETIETMKRVGNMLPRELKCTCEGGLCKTPRAVAKAKTL